MLPYTIICTSFETSAISYWFRVAKAHGNEVVVEAWIPLYIYTHKGPFKQNQAATGYRHHWFGMGHFNPTSTPVLGGVGNAGVLDSSRKDLAIESIYVQSS